MNIVLSSFFKVGCCEVKVGLKVAAIHLHWVNFIFANFSALAFSGWLIVKTCDQ